MKKLFLILILFSSFKSFAQSSDNIDSLVAIPYDFLVSEPNKFIHKIKEVIPIVEKAENKFIKAKLYSNLALAYSAIGELDNYRDAEIKAISIYEELNNELELTSEYGSFGYHLRRTNIERAKYYMRLAIKIGEKNKLDEKLTAIYDNYGTLLEQQGKSDSAIFYYEKGLNLKYMLSDSIGIPYSLNHLAGIYAALGSMEKAFQQMKLSDEYRAKEKNNYGRAENAVIYGELYLMTGNHTKAIAKFNESLLLAKSIGNKYMIQYNYQQLANAYEKKKDFGKAFSNLKNFITYKDSISNLEINKKIARL
jgi:tetratricopeptide (TPR) repeat protein